MFHILGGGGGASFESMPKSKLKTEIFLKECSV
jgi:hypothetical protein